MTEKGKPETRTALAEYEESHGGPPLAVAVAQPPSLTQLAVEVSGLKNSQVEVLRRTICKKFSDDQLLLYVAICARKGVDPFTEAYGFPNADGGLAFGLRIDGMRALAMRTGDFLSRHIETVFKDGNLVGAKAVIHRRGMAHPVIEEAWMAEYAKTGPTAFGWNQFPETMIRKVAESKALRAAFPDALSGIYEPAEIQE
jgi:hypothetical protein